MVQTYAKQLIFSRLRMLHRKIRADYKQAQNLTFYS